MTETLRIVLLYLLSLPVLGSTVARVLFVLQGVQGAPWIDQRYADHPWLSLLHLCPGALFLLLGPLQFSDLLRRRHLAWHRWSGRLFVASGGLSGIGVVWMVWAFPAVGGALTQWVTVAVVGAMLWLMALAVIHIRYRRTIPHRHAMMRAYALGLSVSTTRIFIDLADWLAGIPFADSFVMASALGVALNVAVTEALIWRARPSCRAISCWGIIPRL